MDFKYIIQKVEQHIHNWETRFISKAGTHTLVQSNLEALPTYVCSSSLLPHSIANSIDNMHIIFWRQQEDKNAIPLISWEKICKPKSKGGLGLKETMALNKAFIAKLGWKILNDNDNLWVNIMRQKYPSSNANQKLLIPRSGNIFFLRDILEMEIPSHFSLITG